VHHQTGTLLQAPFKTKKNSCLVGPK